MRHSSNISVLAVRDTGLGGRVSGRRTVVQSQGQKFDPKYSLKTKHGGSHLSFLSWCDRDRFFVQPAYSIGQIPSK